MISLLVEAKTGKCPECWRTVPVKRDLNRPLEDETIPERSKYLVVEHGDCPVEGSTPLAVYKG